MAQGYSIFTQGQGPVVPISLFSEAATAGINAGNALPTTTTSIINQGIKGYQTGLEIQQTQQQNTIRQNQIENIPTQNKLLQAQARSAEATAQIQENKALIDSATQAEELDAVNSTLKLQAADADQKLQVLNLKSQFEKEMQSADPRTQAQIVLSGKYQGLFSQDPKLGAAAYYGVEVNPYNGLSPQQRSTLSIARTKATLVDQNTKAAQQRYPAYQKAEGELFHDPISTRIGQTLNQAPEVLWQHTEPVETGSLKTGSDGVSVLTNNYGDPVYNSDKVDRAGAKPEGFDFVYTDPVTSKKRIVAKGIASSDPFMKLWGDWIGEKRVQDGSNLNSQLQAFDRQTGTAPSPKPRPQSQSVGNMSKINPTSATSQPESEPIYVSQAKQMLNISDTTANDLAMPLKDLNDSIVRERLDPTYRSSGSAAAIRQASLDTIGKSMAYSQFQSSPAIRAQYTEAEVERYNREQEEQIRLKAPLGFSETQIQQMFAPFRAYSPAQLYYKKNLSMITQQLKSLENSYIMRANEAAIRFMNAQTKPERFLSALSGG